MNLIKQSLLVVAGTLAIVGMSSESAMARGGHGERHITVYPNNKVFAGKNNSQKTAYLKNLIKEQYPRLGQKLRDFKLMSVTVTGKSISRRYSTSNLTLEIDGRYHDQAVLGQGRHNRNDVTTLHSHRGRQAVGTWQIQFRGRTKVNKIDLHLKKRANSGGGHGGGHGRLGTALGGSQEVQNFKTDSDTFHAPRGSVYGDQILVQAVRGKVDIISVTVNFANGGSKQLWDITGRVSAGSGRKAINIGQLAKGRNVTSVNVRARSTEISFPQAALKVYVR